MEVSLSLTRPDGTPLEANELPAQGTLIVLQLDESKPWNNGHARPFQPAMTARILGWVPAPRADAAARRLLRAACRALNLRDEGEAADDQRRSAVRAPG